MAFTLSFDALVAVAAWEAFFAARPHYTVEEAPDGAGLHALYENPDTEVTFRFEWSAGQARFEIEENRVRPFALEADAEVAAFGARFDRGWIAGRLLREWEAGRASAKKARGALPAAQVEQIWRWNWERHSLAARLELFVPRIWLTAVRGTVKTGADWAPDVPSALPEVDLLWVSWVGAGERLIPGKRLTEWAPLVSAALPYRRMGEEGVGPAVLSALEKLPKGAVPKKLPFASLREFGRLGIVESKG